MKKVNFLKLYLIAMAILLLGCRIETIPLSSENILTAITVNDGNKDMAGSIAANNITFSDSAVAETSQVTVKSILFSEKASANVKKNDVIPINKLITIRAENGSTKSYVMSLNVSTATTTGNGMTTDTGNGITTTGKPVVGTITGASLAIAGITTSVAMLSGLFTKQNNPILTELGILITTDAMLNLELTTDNEAPNGAVKLTTTDEQLALINMPTSAIIPLSFTVPNLNAFTTYYFRSYAAISGGNVAYTDKIQRMTLAGTVSVSDFTINLPYNVAEMNSDGLFRMNYSKDPSPIRSFGVLITSGDGINLELNGENAPAGARLIRGNTTAIAAANASTNGTLALSATIPALETNYSFRGYVQNDAGITYTNVSSQTTPSAFTLIPDDNFRNAILSCINTNGAVTLSGQDGSFSCRENFNENNITARGNSIRTDALHSITEFNYGDYSGKPDGIKISSLSGIEQMVNLTRLNVSNNFLSSLDVSNNTALTTLFVSNNTSLSSLDVSNNTALTQLNVQSNSLSSLDVSANTALTTLNVSRNSLSSLDVAANTALDWLFVNNNTSLSSLDISNNTELMTLNVTANTLLTCIMVDASQLTGGINVLPPFLSDTGTGLLKANTQTLSVSCP